MANKDLFENEFLKLEKENKDKKIVDSIFEEMWNKATKSLETKMIQKLLKLEKQIPELLKKRKSE